MLPWLQRPAGMNMYLVGLSVYSIRLATGNCSRHGPSSIIRISSPYPFRIPHFSKKKNSIIISRSPFPHPSNPIYVDDFFPVPCEHDIHTKLAC